MNFASKSALAAILTGGVVLDQLVKILARATLVPGQVHSYLGGIFQIHLVENHGAFLSLGSSLPEGLRQAIFTGGVGLFLAGMIVWLFTTKQANAQTKLVFVWFAAGGVGNLIDRALFQGGVTDYLFLGLGPLRTGIFNLADMYITFAMGLAIWQAFKKEKPAS